MFDGSRGTGCARNRKLKINNRGSENLRGILFVGRLEFADEISEEESARGFAGSGIVIYEVAAAPAKDFAHGVGARSVIWGTT